MKTRTPILLVCALFLLVFVTACGKSDQPVQPTAEVEHVDPEPFYDPAEITANLEALLSGEPLLVEETAVPVADPTEVPGVAEVELGAETDSCVECHTDQEALIASARPEDEVVIENEGEG